MSSGIDELLAAVTPQTSPAPGSTDWVPVWNLASAPSVGPEVVIADQVLTANGQVFDFTNIPQTFAYLRVICDLAIDQANSNNVLIAFNGDTTNANYTRGITYPSGATSTFFAADRLSSLQAAGTSFPSACPGELIIPNYAGTRPKGWITTLSLARGSASSSLGQNGGGNWSNSAPITRLTFTPNVGGFVAGSRMTLIGVAAANVLASGLVQPVPALTLPSAPGDSQEAILVDSLVAATQTYSWRLMWVAALGRWIYLGGPPLQYQKPPSTAPMVDAVADAITSIYPAYANLPTTGAVGLTVPRSGLYSVGLGMRADNLSDGAQCLLSYKRGAAAPVNADGIVHRILNWTDLYREYETTLTAGQLLQLQASTTSSGSGEPRIFNILFKLTPVWLT